MATINGMRTIATQIENESNVGGNTASRVGGLFNDVVDKLEEDETTLSNAVTNINNTKQDVLTFDAAPTNGSTNPVTSEGIKVAVDNVGDSVKKVSGGTIILGAIQKITGKHVYNGNVSGTAIGYFDNIASGYGCYIFDVSNYQGDDVVVYGTSHSTGYRFVFCRNYATLPQSADDYNNDPTLWSNNMITCLSGKGWTSNLDYNATLTIPSGANYLILEKSSTKTPTATLNYVGVKNELLPLINAKADESELSLDNYSVINSAGRVAGYINGSGNIASGSYFYVDYYPVTAGKTIRITQKLHTGTARAYAFYNSTSMSSSTLVELGALATSIADVTIRSVPTGATYIGITEFKSSQHGLEENNPTTLKNAVIELQEDVDDLTASVAGNDTRTLMAWSCDANNFYCAYNDGNGIEYTYWFKRCMANNLYTFYKVGYRTVTRTLPSVAGISAGTGITYINETSSDNIGPMQMTSGYWVGGNHHYPDENSGQHTIYKTAQTDSVSIYIDNVLKTSGGGYAKDITIEVVNTIFDPAYPPSEGDESLSTPLATESVKYVVVKNTIEVGLSLKFSSTTPSSINKYYGMQSMFSGETYYITPNGAYNVWRNNSDNPTGSFDKTDYPNFNRFIEKKSGAYQSAYLIPVALGMHNKIASSEDIFVRSNNKNYHHIISSGQVVPLAGSFVQWKGCYTFFHAPLVDDGTLFVYRGIIDGYDALFVSTSSSYIGGVPVPSELALKNMEVLEAIGITDEDGGENFVNGGSGVYINGNGSLILIFK